MYVCMYVIYLSLAAICLKRLLDSNIIKLITLAAVSAVIQSFCAYFKFLKAVIFHFNLYYKMIINPFLMAENHK